MKHFITSAALVAAYASTVFGSAQFVNGNWYRDQTDSITYTGWGLASTYNKVVDMSNGQCLKEPVAFDGGMAPLDGEVSFHFRGPMHLKQFAFYTPGSSSNKRDTKPSVHQKRHNHAHLHHERGLGNWVTATINGDVVSWANGLFGHSTKAPDSPTPASTSAIGKATSSPDSTGERSAKQTSNAGAGNWGRHAYYSAVDNVADGLVFLNNKGGQGSGTFDNIIGNSLSYASSDSTSGSASPQLLSDTFLNDGVEVAIYTDTQCQGDSCGYYRPGTVAYHGFDGSSKLFLLEFDMPMSGKKGWNMDMPAVWMLNAMIARTEQYGDCSCWPECGEFDIFEVLDAGNFRAKTCVHSTSVSSGGDSDWFQRPTEKSVKVAVIMDGPSSTGAIHILPDDTNFAETIPDEIVAKYGKKEGLLTKLKSTIFKLGS